MKSAAAPRLTPAAGAPAVLTAAVLVGVWLLVYPHTPDLAGQAYRVSLFRDVGFTVWDGNWYGGHHIPAYSLLFPPLAALLGIGVVGAFAVIASSALFAALAQSFYGEQARWGAALFAVAATGDVWSGRVTFALGVSAALAAALALRRGHAAGAALLALLCAATSPVAGALLALAGLTACLSQRSPRALVLLGGPALALIAVLALLFPEGGTEPYPILSFAASAAVIALLAAALPAPARSERMGALLYLLVCTACLLIHTPVGSNVERYGVLLAGPVLLCACARHRPGAARAGLTPLAALALTAASVWMVWGPVRETAAVTGGDATAAAYYLPVERFIAAQGGPPVRIEVPLTRSHWEAALLAPSVPLARGWDKQLEERYDGVLLRPHLTAASYRAWLMDQAVAYVALPDAPLDPSSAQEGTLIRSGLPYLQLAAHSAHWRIYRVAGANPLASGPGSMTALGHDWFELDARSAGSFLVREHYTRYWQLSSGDGCVAPAGGGWTQVTLRRAGRARVSARFSFARALGGGSACSGG